MNHDRKEPPYYSKPPKEKSDSLIVSTLSLSSLSLSFSFFSEELRGEREKRVRERVRERESVCVCVRERERERAREDQTYDITGADRNVQKEGTSSHARPSSVRTFSF